MIPWSEGRFLVWDAICMDTFCESHRQRAAQEEGGAAAHAEKEKTRKYVHLNQAYCSMPIVFESYGSIGPEPRKSTEVIHWGAQIICTLAAMTLSSSSSGKFNFGDEIY